MSSYLDGVLRNALSVRCCSWIWVYAWLAVDVYICTYAICKVLFCTCLTASKRLSCTPLREAVALDREMNILPRRASRHAVHRGTYTLSCPAALIPLHHLYHRSCQPQATWRTKYQVLLVADNYVFTMTLWKAAGASRALALASSVDPKVWR